MDRLTPSQRSKVMARVRSRNTLPELLVRSAAHAMGLRFRLHRRNLIGTPDLIFPKYRVAIFVHGCFWHQHPGCKRATWPQNRADFWGRKLSGNVERDRNVRSQLKSEGWRVAVIWECEAKKPAMLERTLQRIFRRTSRKTV
ncbi:MAG TPA: very short patch repair endonuclease [Bradyrhizobium sp.]|nr:very short patch repair endonuclease [Bradyrhizobium sp.]